MCDEAIGVAGVDHCLEAGVVVFAAACAGQRRFLESTSAVGHALATTSNRAASGDEDRFEIRRSDVSGSAVSFVVVPCQAEEDFRLSRAGLLG
jgi:hypothetical protein